LEIIKNQKSILDSIIFEIADLEEQTEGIIFFMIKDLVVTGYFTSEIGIKGIGYMGITFNVWDDISGEEFKDYNVEYDWGRLTKCINQNSNEITELR